MIMKFNPDMVEFFISLFAIMLAIVLFNSENGYLDFPNWVIVCTGASGLGLFMALLMYRPDTYWWDDVARLFFNFSLVGSMLYYGISIGGATHPVVVMSFHASSLVLILCGAQTIRRMWFHQKKREVQRVNALRATSTL